MAITWKTMAFPDDLLTVEAGTFRLVTAHKSAGSMFAGGVRAYGLIQQRWEAECTLAPQAQEDWQALEAFIARLEGQVVLFTCHDPAHELPLGAGAGHSRTATGSAVTITGAAVSGATVLTGATSAQVKTGAARDQRSVVMKGLLASSLAFRKGDFFELGRNLYMVTGDVTADASGEARVPFLPRLRYAAAADDIVNLKEPKGRFMLKTSDAGAVTRSPGLIGRGSLSMIELPFTAAEAV